MKTSPRLILSLLILFMLPALAQEPADVAIVINGQELAKDTPPIMVNGRVLIPLRPVFIALGAEVKFEDKMITATRGPKVVHLSPDTNIATIDGKPVLMDVPPVLVGADTYVPLRFVAQALGDKVAFDAAAKTITVSPAEDPIDVPPDRISLLTSHLKQLVVGNQGAILKVRNLDGNQEVYYRGLDDRDTAPYNASDQSSILTATELSSDLGHWVTDVIEAFPVLPKREAIAFLGLVYSIPDDAALDPGPVVDAQVEQFLIEVLGENPDVVVRRQAVLSMAVGEPVDQQVLESVLNLYESSENLWETFPVQQFFQYHATQLRGMPNFSTVRSRVANVNSLYTANILRYLDEVE